MSLDDQRAASNRSDLAVEDGRHYEPVPAR
jgi:hypothetical protein